MPRKTLKLSGFENIKKYKDKPVTLIVGISVGDEKHEGERIEKLIEEINSLYVSQDVIISSCVIAVCDTLQSPNYMVDGKTSKAESLALAKEKGDIWISNHSSKIEKLKMPHQIIRWDTWRKNTPSTINKMSIQSFFNKEPAKKAIEDSINSFSKRFVRNYKKWLKDSQDIVEIDDTVLKKSCREYLQEECDVIMRYWPNYAPNTCKFVIYPGKMTAALQAAYNEFVVDKDNFHWQKYQISEIKTSSSKSEIVSLIEKDSFYNKIIGLIDQLDEDKKLVMLTIFAGYTSILNCKQSNISSTLFLMEEFTKSAWKLLPKENRKTQGKPERRYSSPNLIRF